MNKIRTINQVNGNTDLGLLFLRIGAAALMLTHGIPKMIMLSTADNIQFISVFGLSPVFSLTLAVFAEVFCSLLLLFGLATKVAAVPLITTMILAAFYIHAADPFSRQELPLIYLSIYVVLLITGAGRYSIDHILKKKNVRSFNSKLSGSGIREYQESA